MPVLVLNAGSATLKFALFARAQGAPATLRGSIEHFGRKARLHLRTGAQTREVAVVAPDHAAAARLILEHVGEIGAAAQAGELMLAHRFVHGGARYREPLRLDAAALAELETLVALAPLHMGPALAVARQMAAALGADLPAVAVFDTAFFADLPAAAHTYALPQALLARHGLRRYGFHGLAHRSLYAQYCADAGAVGGHARVISFQLGNGCSAAAIAGGRALDCSMGFTPLEGLVMGTRAGDLDPGIVLELLRRGLSLAELDELLQHHSGLRGLSGLSGDMRELLEHESRGHAGARLAIEVFCHRVRKYLGAYLATLGGADAVIFGGGIGEHAAEIRRRCLEGFEWAGLQLDAARNRSGLPGRISTAEARLHAYLLVTDEEHIIATDARASAARAAVTFSTHQSPA